MALLALMMSALVVPFVLPAQAQQQDGRARQLKQEEAKGQSERRLALVIGNGAYANAPRLKNPANDSTDMAAALSQVGFTVEHGVDLSFKQMKFMIREFGKKLRGGGQGLFYFAGHGVQLRGRNFLIPVDADIQSETDVEDQGVDANLVLGLMDEAGNGLNVVILDACRNNPFARSFRSASDGLAQIEAPTGTLIAYATAPGRVARDGAGRNGAYTAELLNQMRVPGLPVEELLKRVRANLKQQTKGEQVPWESSSLVGDFYLNRATSASNTTSNPPGVATGAAANPAAVEQELWDSIKSSTDAEDFRFYLKEYPDGPHAVIARNNLRRLEAAKKPTVNDTASNPSNSRVSSAPKPTAKELLQRSYGLWRGCDYDQAINVATEVINSNPATAEGYTIRGAAHLFKLETSQALSDLTQAISLQPENAQALRWRAMAYLVRISSDDASLAMKDLEEVLRLIFNPKEAWEYEARGYALFQKLKYDAAISEFDKAIDLDPYYLPAYVFRGASRIWKASTFSDSVGMKDISEAIRLNPKFAGAYFYRAMYHQFSSNYESAIADLSEVIRYAPRALLAYKLRGAAFEQQNKYDLAIKDFSEVIRFGEKDYFSNRASAYAQIGNYDSALKDYTAAISYAPNNASNYTERAKVYRALGQIAQAEADERKAKELQPKK
jgi:tetratricopeptide (TPR) repeat protein